MRGVRHVVRWTGGYAHDRWHGWEYPKVCTLQHTAIATHPLPLLATIPNVLWWRSIKTKQHLLGRAKAHGLSSNDACAMAGRCTLTLRSWPWRPTAPAGRPRAARQKDCGLGAQRIYSKKSKSKSRSCKKVMKRFQLQFSNNGARSLCSQGDGE